MHSKGSPKIMQDAPSYQNIVEEIHNGNLKNEEFEDFGVFNLKIPKKVNGVDSRILNPENCWDNNKEYKTMLKKLALLFLENADKYYLEDYGDAFANIITI